MGNDIIMDYLKNLMKKNQNIKLFHTLPHFKKAKCGDHKYKHIILIIIYYLLCI
jgi:hypothetical protein